MSCKQLHTLNLCGYCHSIPIPFYIPHSILMQILNDVLVTSTNSRDSWFQTLYGILLGYSGRSATNSPNKDYRKAAQSMVIWILIIFTRPHKV